MVPGLGRAFWLGNYRLRNELRDGNIAAVKKVDATFLRKEKKGGDFWDLFVDIYFSIFV